MKSQKNQDYIINMDSKYFLIDVGGGSPSFEGPHCSYCGKPIVPQKDEDTGEYSFQCVCSIAKEELSLKETREAIDEALQSLEDEFENTTRRIMSTFFISAHQESIDLLQQDLETLRKEEANDNPASTTERRHEVLRLLQNAHNLLYSRSFGREPPQ